MKYPLHRVGSCLLTKDEQCASSILTDMLSSVKDESQCVSRGEVDEDSEVGDIFKYYVLFAFLYKTTVAFSNKK